MGFSLLRNFFSSAITKPGADAVSEVLVPEKFFNSKVYVDVLPGPVLRINIPNADDHDIAFLLAAINQALSMLPPGLERFRAFPARDSNEDISRWAFKFVPESKGSEDRIYKAHESIKQELAKMKFVLRDGNQYSEPGMHY